MRVKRRGGLMVLEPNELFPRGMVVAHGWAFEGEGVTQVDCLALMLADIAERYEIRLEPAEPAGLPVQQYDAERELRQALRRMSMEHSADRAIARDAWNARHWREIAHELGVDAEPAPIVLPKREPRTVHGGGVAVAALVGCVILAALLLHVVARVI